MSANINNVALMENIEQKKIKIMQKKMKRITMILNLFAIKKTYFLNEKKLVTYFYYSLPWRIKIKICMMS